MFTNKFSLIFLSSVLAVGCGGGGDSSPSPQSSDAAPTPQGAGADTTGQNVPPGANVPASDIESLLTQRTWYQVNFLPPELGSRIDALYKFQIVANGARIGQRLTINIRGNNISAPGELAVNFNWSIDGNNKLTLVIGNLGGLTTHTEVIQLTYRPETDQIITDSSDFGPGVWEGCNSPNRPTFTLARCS
jgi:hypothetical protein